MITTVLADDHPLIREGLRTLLEREDHCRIVGEAADGLTALRLVADLTPELAILDVQMPDLGGLEVARRIQERSPETTLIMLSMHSDETYVRDALRYGALGYVLKGSATEEMLDAVKTVMAGRHYLSPSLAERAFDAYSRQAAVAAAPTDRYELLTSREREVLQLAAQGLSNLEIGDRLTISPRTAETHRTNLLRKLGMSSQTELVRFALSRGLISRE